MGTHTRLLKTMVMVALSLTVLLAGCAGATRAASTQKIVAAERAIHDATQSEAALTAAPDLDFGVAATPWKAVQRAAWAVLTKEWA